MNIAFKREGGFSNIRLRADVDAGRKQLIYGAKQLKKPLCADEILALEAEVSTACFPNLPVKMPAPSQAADSFSYALILEKDGARYTVQTSEPVPEALRPLIDHLTRLAKGKQFDP